MHLNGTFDFNRTPLAPLGTRVIIHEKPAQQLSWAPHGKKDGWYMGHAPKHYRCYQIYVTSMAATRIADTVEFFPREYNMPKTSSTDNVKLAARALIHALLHPAPAAPCAQLGDQQFQALHQLTNIFDQALDNQPAMTKTVTRQPPRVDKPSPRVEKESTPNPAINPRRSLRVAITQYLTRHKPTAPHQAYHVATITPSMTPLNRDHSSFIKNYLTGIWRHGNITFQVVSGQETASCFLQASLVDWCILGADRTGVQRNKKFGTICGASYARCFGRFNWKDGVKP
jgi:hypothetical protein